MRARSAPAWAPARRSTPSWSSPTRSARLAEGAIAPWAGGPDQRVLPAPAAGGRRRRGLRPRHPVGEAAGPGPEGRAARRRRPGARQLPQPLRPQPVLLRRLRGRRALDRAALRRDRQRLLAREVRGLHARGAVPHLPGHPAQAGDPRASPSGGIRSPSCPRCRSATPRTRCTACELTDRERLIGERVLKEIHARLGFLVDVGLHYLSLDRAAATLAGGEAQRIRLATQIGSGLVGVLYVLDEPSIGLHQRDNHRLIETLVRLKNLGQHADRRRARRGHDPHRRLGGRHRPAGRGARRQHRRQRHGRRSARRTGLDHRRLPVGPDARSRCRCCAGRGSDGPRARRRGRPRAQSAQRRRRVPARLLRRRHRCQRVGQVDPGQRHPLRRRWPTRSTAPSCRPAGTSGSAGSSSSTRWSASTSRRSAARRGPTRPPTPASSTTSASSSPRPPRRRSAAISRAASPSTSRVAAARTAPATAPSRSR